MFCRPRRSRAELPSATAESEPLVVTAACTASSHLELQQVAPPLRLLHSLLRAAPFRESSGDQTAWGYSWEELWRRIGCSQKELMAGLASAQAAHIRGRWCILDSEYRQSLLQLLLLSCAAQGWPTGAFEEEEMVQLLTADGCDPDAVRHALRLFGAPGAEPGMWALDERGVCVERARSLLARSERTRLDEFMAAWRAALPEGFTPDAGMLRGEALVEVQGLESWVCRFSLSELPRTAKERFEALFARKPRWTMPEIEPYLREVDETGATDESLLLAWTRRTAAMRDVPEFFSARFTASV